MKTWQEHILGCFAGVTAPFAMHPNDEKRAITMMEQDVTWAEAAAEILHYFTGQNVTAGEMDKQMKRAEEKLRPWLD